jgi:Predicted permeases
MEIISTVLTATAFQGAIFSTIFIILLGYYLRKSNKVGDDASKVLTSILLNIALPALAFNAFMSDINDATFTTGLNTFIFGFIAYVILIIITYVYSIKYKGNKLDAMRGLTIFGSTTFFGIPIITAFFGAEGALFANLFNIAYRVFLYSYGLMLFAETKFDLKNLKTIFLNPIVIATFVGFFIWMFQGSLPQVEVATAVNGETVMKSYAIFRLDITMPWFIRATTFLANLCSPLAWLAIGMTLAKISFKEAAKNVDSWIYSVVKLFVVPAIFLLIIIIMNMVDVLPLTYLSVAGIIIMLATPPATVAVSFAINYDKEAVLSSNASLLSTILAVAAIIFWLVVLAILNHAGIII